MSKFVASTRPGPGGIKGNIVGDIGIVYCRSNRCSYICGDTTVDVA